MPAPPQNALFRITTFRASTLVWLTTGDHRDTLASAVGPGIGIVQTPRVPVDAVWDQLFSKVPVAQRQRREPIRCEFRAFGKNAALTAGAPRGATPTSARRRSACWEEARLMGAKL